MNEVADIAFLTVCFSLLLGSVCAAIDMTIKHRREMRQLERDQRSDLRLFWALAKYDPCRVHETDGARP